MEVGDVVLILFVLLMLICGCLHSVAGAMTRDEEAKEAAKRGLTVDQTRAILKKHGVFPEFLWTHLGEPRLREAASQWRPGSNFRDVRGSVVDALLVLAHDE